MMRSWILGITSALGNHRISCGGSCHAGRRNHSSDLGFDYGHYPRATNNRHFQAASHQLPSNNG
jgi:hypothetical protein